MALIFGFQLRRARHSAFKFDYYFTHNFLYSTDFYIGLLSAIPAAKLSRLRVIAGAGGGCRDPEYASCRGRIRSGDRGLFAAIPLGAPGHVDPPRTEAIKGSVGLQNGWDWHENDNRRP
jgi:hypothetical protein